ncbi:MAG: hypothetical protein WAJ92_14930 [Candidatus Acidiferrales bacterium]
MPRQIISFHTDFDLTECLRRLREGADPGAPGLGSPGSKPLLARWDGSEVQIWKRIEYRNDVRPFFRGRVTADGRGTRLEGSYDLPALTKVLPAVILAAFGCGAAGALYEITIGPGASRPNKMFLLIPVLVFAIAAAAIAFGVAMIREQKEFITDALQQLLLARVETRE